MKVPWTGIWSGFTTLSALQAFPDLLGSPALPFTNCRASSQSNYIETNGVYVGLIVIFLAGLGAFASIARRSLLGWFFVGVVVAWVAVYHDLLGLWSALTHLPLVGLLLPTRSCQVVVFALSVLAAVGVDALLPASAPGGLPRSRGSGGLDDGPS